MKKITVVTSRSWQRLNRIFLLATAMALTFGPVVFLNQTATAQQITTRSLLISSAQAGGTANYTFTFTPGSTTKIESFKIQSCTTPLGACVVPSGISLSTGTLSTGGTFQGATAFAADTSTAGCTTADVYCAKRTDITPQTLTAHAITLTGVTNQATTNCASAANCTFFERITTFSDVAFATTVDKGVVASSTTQLFTVNAAIQEQLSFCIGNTTVDDDTSAIPTCTTITGTSLDLGTLNSGDVTVSPVDPATSGAGGDNHNGLAEITTNSVNGTSVAYDAIQQTGTNHQGALRVLGATCNAGIVNTDQCVNSDNTAGASATIVPGVESFGMAIAGVSCANVTAYTCTYGTGNYLNPTTNYNCDGTTAYTTDKGEVAATSHCKFFWDESGSASTIASSSSIVGGEALLLKFAATPNLVTPTGAYTAEADFVALPTY